MYCKPTDENLREFARNWVDHMFEQLQDAKHRGENFKWENFSKMVAGLAGANLGMSYDSDAKDSVRLKEYIEKMAAEKVKLVLNG